MADDAAGAGRRLFELRGAAGGRCAAQSGCTHHRNRLSSPGREEVPTVVVSGKEHIPPLHQTRRSRAAVGTQRTEEDEQAEQDVAPANADGRPLTMRSSSCCNNNGGGDATDDSSAAG